MILVCWMFSSFMPALPLFIACQGVLPISCSAKAAIHVIKSWPLYQSHKFHMLELGVNCNPLHGKATKKPMSLWISHDI